MYKGKIRVKLIKDGSEIRVYADQAGFRYLSGLCSELASSDYDTRHVPHFHVEPALNTAEEGSVPMELFLTAEP